MCKPILVARELDGGMDSFARAIGASESNRIFEVRRVDLNPSKIVFHSLVASCIAEAEHIAMKSITEKN